jgi:hypothetical protein
MGDKIIVFLLLTTVIIGSVFLWFVYIRQYRFATLLFDLLPFYPNLVLLGLVTSIVCIVLLVNEDGLTLLLSILVLMNYVVQFTLFWRWFSSYRLKNYSKFLQKLTNKSEIRVISVIEWLNQPQKDPSAILVLIRHDIDINLARARRMLSEEKKHNISSCNYFRNNAERYSFNQAKKIIKEITKTGQSTIGFHYESIRNANGDISKAIKLFSKEVEEFRLIYPIRMVSAHGDRYHNRRLVSEKLVDLKSLNLESSYFLPHDYYLSDAGGFHHFTYLNNRKETITEKLQILDEIALGSLVQILIHPDWWF